MQQLLVSQELVLMLLSLYRNHSTLINYAQTSCRVVFGMENQQEDAGNPLLPALIIQDQ